MSSGRAQQYRPQLNFLQCIHCQSIWIAAAGFTRGGGSTVRKIYAVLDALITVCVCDDVRRGVATALVTEFSARS